MNFSDPQTEAERRALAILRDAELRNDGDYKKIALLIDEAVAELVATPESDTVH